MNTLTNSIKRPVRQMRDWNAAKLVECDACGQYRMTVPDETHSNICASCCDAVYTAELESFSDAAEAQLAELRGQSPAGEIVQKLEGYANPLFVVQFSEEPEVGDEVYLYPVPPAASQQDYMCDSAYIAGLKAGYNLGVDENGTELNECIENYRKQMIGAKPLAASQSYTVPEGYALVPSTIYLDESDIESICSQCGNGSENYGDFTRGILWVGNIQDDEGNVTHGLHISSDDYPEEGGITLAKFAAVPRKDGDA